MHEIAWLFFVGVSLAIIFAPGQDMVLVMSRGMSQGALAGIATGAGVSTGLLAHTILATLGLGTLLQASEAAYLLLKYVGAAYLLYLGIRLVLSGSTGLSNQVPVQTSYGRLFAEGAFSNLSNPKVALFYFSFLPQFVPSTVQNPTMLIFVLGVTFAALTFLVKAPVGFFAGTLSNWFRAHPTALAWIYRTSGAVLIGIGLRLAFEERR